MYVCVCDIKELSYMYYHLKHNQHNPNLVFGTLHTFLNHLNIPMRSTELLWSFTYGERVLRSS